MRARTYSITEIREVIGSLPEEFEKDVDIVTVIQHGKPVMTILPTSTYQHLPDAQGNH